MCTNYRLAIADMDKLTVWFGHLSMSDWVNPEPGKSGSELYPGYTGHVIHRGSNVLAKYRWGFTNFMDPKRLLVNAVAETVVEKRTFAKAFRETRCLVPATEFHDYRKSDPPGQKGRYLFTTADEFIAFAGSWQVRGRRPTVHDHHDRIISRLAGSGRPDAGPRPADAIPIPP